MTVKLSKVDDLILHEHHWLASDDNCFFLREYTAGAGYAHGDTNNLISNLKKKPERRDKPDWKYKVRAIQQAGRELREAIGDKPLCSVTIVPIPPSKTKANRQEYDDRLIQIVRVMTAGLPCDVRELVLQRADMPAAHESAVRAKPQELYENYYVDEKVANPVPTRILIIDDVLTAGAHFAAMKRRLLERFPGVTLFGCFFARRAVPKAEEVFKDFKDDLGP